MKILQIVSGANEIAGVQRHAAWLAKGSRFQHMIATTPAPKFEAHVRALGIELTVVKSPLAFLDLARRFNPDVVHAHLGKALVFGAVQKRFEPRTRLIYSQHILYPSSSKDTSILGSVRRAVVRWGYGQTDRIIAVSRAVEDAMRGRGEYFPVELIYNGVPARSPGSRAPVPGRLRVIGISRLQSEKRPRDFIEVAKYLDDERVSIVVYGTGVMEKALRAEAETLNSRTRVTFAGFRSDIERALAEADLFMHFGEEEACPLAVLEALTWGLPVLTIGVGGNVELVTDGVGRLFAVGDATGMAAALRELVANPDSLNDMADAALAASSRFSLERMVQQIDALYAALGAQLPSK